ncbi:MAG: threonine/serine exporter family protein [Oscillospiraceae bacterium]|nr:threonine/serine exporter family protein [Oscillospiraceae bacterium]
MSATNERILKAACKLGRNILENGGEIYRVEETINFFLEAYGIFNAQIFAIPATIIVTIEEEGERPLTIVERVKGSSINLDKLSKFNDLSRRACQNKPSIESVLKDIESIRSEKPYGFFTSLMAFGFTAFFFCLFWKGDLRDSLVAFVCGLSTKYCLDFMSRGKTNIFFSNAVSSAVIAYIAILCVNLGLAHHYDKIIIGAIMSLVPGVAITNIMRDIIAGDVITGTTKLAEVLLIALAIAVGIAIAMSSVIFFGGGL